MKTEKLTHERLIQVLSYNEGSGKFFYKIPRQSVSVGDEAGSNDGAGYLLIMIDGVRYKAHRLAWFYVNGEFPNGIIDHKNRIKSDNRIENLRVANHSLNGQNRSVGSNNKSGVRGVSKRSSSGNWQACIQAGGKNVFLGEFSSIREAAVARCKAELDLHQFSPMREPESI